MDQEGLKPLGIAKEVAGLKEYIDDLLKTWDEKYKEVKSSWMPKIQMDLVKVTKFLLNCLDGLILFIDRLVDNGPDKKATVLAAIAILYDYIIKGALPIWMLPFATKVRQFIIYTLISTAIDFMVSKYKEGAWKATNKEV